MTERKDFKALVRARMKHTGENYTAARAAMERPATATAPRHEAQREQQLIVDRWFGDGRLRAIPARRKVRAAVLLEVLARFVPGRTYSEAEVRQILEPVHEDFAYLRRELVILGYLNRDNGVYRVCLMAPIRSEQQRRELPVWEEIWLPDFAARASAFRAARRAS